MPHDPTADEIEQAIRQLGARAPEESIPGLTAVANRAIIELHRVARAEANQRRGQADWGKWARLANAVRSGVLQLASIRDSVKGLGLAATPPDRPAPQAAPQDTNDAPTPTASEEDAPA